MDHPSEGTLKRFVAGTTAREESRAVVAHLVKGCSRCATRLRRLIEPPPVPAVSYEEALDHFDQELIDNLESEVKPAETLRVVLEGLFQAPVERADPKKK